MSAFWFGLLIATLTAPCVDAIYRGDARRRERLLDAFEARNRELTSRLSGYEHPENER